MECRDIRRLAYRVAEKSHRDAGFKTPLLYLGLDGRIALYPRYRHKVHIIKCQLSKLRDHGLYEYGRLFRIYAHSKIVQGDIHNILTHLFRVLGIIGKGLGVRYHDINLIIQPGFLQLHPFLEGAHIMPDMEPPRRAVASQNDLFHLNAPNIK